LAGIPAPLQPRSKRCASSLIAHPRTNGFCHAISARVRNALVGDGNIIEHHDLYREGFDPCLTAEVGETLEKALLRAEDQVLLQHRTQVANAGGLLIVHPNWWGKPPAILAGWLDRVLVPGVAYRLKTADGLPEGLLSIKKAIVFNTSDTDATREGNDLGASSTRHALCGTASRSSTTSALSASDWPAGVSRPSESTLSHLPHQGCL
jgi:putative NADPH-quinone reductase